MTNRFLGKLKATISTSRDCVKRQSDLSRSPLEVADEPWGCKWPVADSRLASMATVAVGTRGSGSPQHMWLQGVQLPSGLQRLGLDLTWSSCPARCPRWLPGCGLPHSLCGSLGAGSPRGLADPPPDCAFPRHPSFPFPGVSPTS